jgi:hypothetical protein
MSAVEMRHGFFTHAGVMSSVDGVLLRSMAGPTDSDNVGWSLPNRESARPVLMWAPNEGACGLGILGSRGGCPLVVNMIELVDRAPVTEWEGGTKAAPPNAR